MKTQLHSILFAGLSFFAGQSMFAQVAMIPNRGCGSMEYKEMEEKANPSIKALRAQIDDQVRDYIANQKNNPTPTPQAVITMPIVFHVVYNGAAENVSDNCIAQTLISLNKDFRKQNTDFTTKTPAVFQPLGADCEVQFCMASKDPTGAATNGITRTATTVNGFTTDNKVKYTAQGGHDVWDRTKYVNLWICNLSGTLLGYGQLPGGSAATDGVVCHYKYLVATGGCGALPYEKGRTTVHELGHWFGLKHTFQGGCGGTSSSNCTTGGDGVCDTPPVSVSSYGCPATQNTCTETSPFPPPFTSDQNDMTMNYMDYTDDACMVMFTTGQKAIITATMNGTRASLKTSAAANCAAGNGVNELGLGNYVSIFPNPSTGNFSMNITLPHVTSADMVIYNALGEAVLEKKISIPAGNNVDVDMNNHPEGMYLIKMKISEGTITKKIVISR